MRPLLLFYHENSMRRIMFVMVWWFRHPYFKNIRYASSNQFSFWTLKILFSYEFRLSYLSGILNFEKSMFVCLGIFLLCQRCVFIKLCLKKIFLKTCLNYEHIEANQFVLWIPKSWLCVMPYKCHKILQYEDLIWAISTLLSKSFSLRESQWIFAVIV